MSIFEVQTIDSAPEGSRAPLEKLQQAFGMVPNVAGVIANSPVLANIFVPLFAGVHNGTFTEAEIQTLLLTNAVTNACAWAVAFHSYLALKAGLDPADVQAIRERRWPAEPRIAALSAYARALIEKRGHVGDAAVACVPLRRLHAGPGARDAGGQRRLHDHQLHPQHRRAAARAGIPGARLAARNRRRSSRSLNEARAMFPETVHLKIGSLLFDDLDQIDLTGPFEVLSRLPNATHRIYAKSLAPARDLQGLRIMPDATLAEAPQLDILHVPGGRGQEALMDDEEVLGWLRGQAEGAKKVLSVCTGALLCGAAGLLRGKRATTHWASFHLLPWFGAIPVDERVVVDADFIFAAGVTAGIDGALRLAADVRGVRAAHAHPARHRLCAEPPFQSGTPQTAPPEILEAARRDVAELIARREATARRVATRLGVAELQQSA